MKLEATEQLPIYHLKGLGGIFDACRSITKISKDQEKPLKLCFNGTLVTVNPEMGVQQVYDQWNTDRNAYQKNIGKPHSALCPICLEKG